MIHLNEIERLVIRTIKAFYERYRNSPTVDELGKILTMTDDTVVFYLDKLHEKGYVDLVHTSISNRLVIIPLYWE